jgi:Mn2+/Fe2+ NRAMP family transporter
MRIIAILMHIAVICVLSVIFFKGGAPERATDWAWRALFLLLPFVNLYILFKNKKAQR